MAIWTGARSFRRPEMQHAYRATYEPMNLHIHWDMMGPPVDTPLPGQAASPHKQKVVGVEWWSLS